MIKGSRESERFCARTSLDELPQFFNVLKGDMSLVGPRPADSLRSGGLSDWHRRRVLEVKPGITGLWQVNGRSRVKFDDMVRLDLRYAKSWSPWLDIKILLRTPGAVIMVRALTKLAPQPSFCCESVLHLPSSTLDSISDNDSILSQSSAVSERR